MLEVIVVVVRNQGESIKSGGFMIVRKFMMQPLHLLKVFPPSVLNFFLRVLVESGNRANIFLFTFCSTMPRLGKNHFAPSPVPSDFIWLRPAPETPGNTPMRHRAIGTFVGN